MAKQFKRYKVIVNKISRWSNSKSYSYEGTIPELIESFSYTLGCGKGYEYEKGSKKVNMNPRTIKSLITSLDHASHNRCASYQDTFYDYVEL